MFPVLPLAIALALGLGPAATLARGDGVTVYLGSRREIRVEPPRVARGPVIDGRLDDAVWAQAAVLDSFTQGVPIEGVPDSLGTRCLVLYDERTLYVGFRCTDEPRQVQSPITPRDNAWVGDYVCVNIDGFAAHQRSQFFCANAAGIQMDGMDVDGQAESDLAPDYLYASRGSRSARGWEAEMAIPFTSLRFEGGKSQAFGFNASRQVKRTESNLFWAPVTRNINSYHAQMGTLEGLTGLKPGRNLQLNPIVTSTRTGTRESDGLRYGTEPRLGLGAKYGITSGLTADATVSPDFSQVEADASVIDVNERFAIYFPEKRPFFLEGSDLFHSPTDLVYTRQIVDPRFGGKLTGTQGRTSIGAVVAADRAAGDVAGAVPDAVNPYRGHDAYDTILRLKRDVLSNSFVGLLATSSEQVDRYGRDLGVDGRINLNDRWSLAFQRVQSWSRGREVRRVGDAPSITPSQLDSIRAANPRIDATGSSTTLDVQQSSERLDAGVTLLSVSPGYAAELGFVPRTDLTSVTAKLRPHLIATTPTWYTGIHPIADLDQTNRYGKGLEPGRVTDNAWRTGIELRLPRGTYAGAGYRRVFTYFGGQEFPGQGRLQLWGGSSRFQAARADVAFSAGDNVLFDEGVAGRFWSLALTSDLRFSQQFDGTWSLNAEVDRRRRGPGRYAEVVIPRLRLSYQFTKELALRTIGEWDSERRWDPVGALTVSHALALDGLVSYVLGPGTVAYLGYGSRLTGPDAPSMTVSRNTAFAKLSYLWQD